MQIHTNQQGSHHIASLTPSENPESSEDVKIDWELQIMPQGYFQFVKFTFDKETPTPDELKELDIVPYLDLSKGVVITHHSRGPIWFHTFFANLANRAAWVAHLVPSLGAVVVSSRSPDIRAGDILSIQ